MSTDIVLCQLQKLEEILQSKVISVQTLTAQIELMIKEKERFEVTLNDLRDLQNASQNETKAKVTEI